jgi:hypothetical protein
LIRGTQHGGVLCYGDHSSETWSADRFSWTEALLQTSRMATGWNFKSHARSRLTQAVPLLTLILKVSFRVGQDTDIVVIFSPTMRIHGQHINLYHNRFFNIGRTVQCYALWAAGSVV